MVVLRDYGSEKKAHRISILQFIEQTSNSDYQLAAPAGAIEYLLLNGRALVVFDGLDELLDTSDRQRISSDVELFAEMYPSVPIIVTSREVGYEQAPLDEERFEIFRLAPFSASQIDDYVEKWFATSSDLTAAEQKKKAASFVHESRIVPDLTSNPLMLALMCTIYRGEGTIPRNRPDVYGKCAEMLFEKWDKRRGIQVSLPIEAHVRPAMNYLASWIYADENLQRGVPQSSLVQETKKYLLSWCFDDPAEAELAAEQFIEFCSGRAWVFTDTGTKSGGERLYQFTHRTFLEYFTAVHLVQTHRTPAELAQVLNPHIAKREWDIVAQLAFQLKGRGFQGDSDLLIRGLLSASASAPQADAWNFIEFAARCLGFMVPTPAVRRAVTSACLEVFIRRAREGQVHDPSDMRERAQLMAALLSSAAENRTTIADAIRLYVERVVKGTDRDASGLALETILHLELPTQLGETRAAEDVTDFWQAFKNETLKQYAQLIRDMAPGDVGLAIDAVWTYFVTIRELVGWHGIESVFQPRQLRIMNATRVPLATWTIRRFVASPAGAEQPRREASLAEAIGEVLLHSPLPWLTALPDDIHRRLLDEFDVRPRRAEKKSDDSGTLSSGALFGVFVLFALVAETADGRQTLLNFFDRIKNPGFLSLRGILGPWLSEGQFDEAEASRLGFKKEQKALLKSWRTGKIRVLAGNVPENPESPVSAEPGNHAHRVGAPEPTG